MSRSATASRLRRPAGRPLLVAVGAGALLLGGVPAGASTADPAGVAATRGDATAFALLADAARAARARAWSGTQYVATWRDGVATSTVLQVWHDPASGTRVRPGTADSAVAVPSPAGDEHLLAQLDHRFVLSLSGVGTCSGRLAQVVEARRPDGRIAARFWVDRATGLPLRREVWDSRGERLRSSTFTDLDVGPDVEGRQAVSAGTQTAYEADLPSDGWQAPPQLPGGYALFAASHPVLDGARVQHLAYSDGLSTVSVFSQPGTLGDAVPGFVRHGTQGGAVFVQQGAPERLVWAGAGRVFTLVSDAGHDDLLAVVRALPHDQASRPARTARLVRGLARVASWVDPRG